MQTLGIRVWQGRGAVRRTVECASAAGADHIVVVVVVGSRRIVVVIVIVVHDAIVIGDEGVLRRLCTPASRS